MRLLRSHMALKYKNETQKWEQVLTHKVRQNYEPSNLCQNVCPIWTNNKIILISQSNKTIFRCSTLASSSRPAWPPSCPTPRAWTRVWRCTRWRSTGGFRDCLSPLSSSSSTRFANGSWGTTLEGGSKRKPITRETNQSVALVWFCEQNSA